MSETGIEEDARYAKHEARCAASVSMCAKQEEEEGETV